MHRACIVVGSLAQLASQLRAPEDTVRSWVEGHEQPPESFFLAAVEILLLNAEERRGPAN